MINKKDIYPSLAFCFGDGIVMNNYEKIETGISIDSFCDRELFFDTALSAAIASHHHAVCYHPILLSPVVEHSINKFLYGEREALNFYGSFENSFNLEKSFYPEPLLDFKSSVFQVGVSHYAALPLVVGMRRESNRIMPYFSEQNILTDKLWEAEVLKLERMEFMYKELNEDELYFKKLKGKFNPSGRSMKQHFNILQLNKQNKRGF